MTLLLSPLPTIDAVQAGGADSSPNLYSGVVLNQNGGMGTSNGFTALANAYFFQTFSLPSDYPRGQDDLIPPLTGFQVFVGIDAGYAGTATLDWTIDHDISGTGWVTLTNGTAIGAALDGNEVWLTVYLDKPVDINADALTDRFRIGIKGRTASGSTINQAVDYDGTYVTINTQQILVTGNIAPGRLQEGRSYPFLLNGVPSLLTVEVGTGQVLYSVQQGVNRLWYSAPNPLALTFDKVYQPDGVTAFQPAGSDVSLMFRVLAGTVDSGIDFLGDEYRSLVIRNAASNIVSDDPTLLDSFWLSHPNPSQFAVESLYFDMRQGDQAAVIDRLMLNPVTPGMHCQTYYSNDPQPGTDADSWDNLLWTPVGETFQVNNRQVFAFPNPITCNYVKLEFTKLQGRYYAPGNFPKPILYRKYPKWVADYFFAKVLPQLTGDPLVGRITQVQYNALGLLYQYYSGDIVSEPNVPTPLVTTNLSTTSTTNVDFDTLLRIEVSTLPYGTQPGARGAADSLLSAIIKDLIGTDTNYATESVITQVANTQLVSSIDRDSLLIEKNFPDMWFYLTCRHSYRTALATFTNDRAYFAGLKEVSFMRDRYTSRFDSSLYIEDAGDTLNVARNDFETVDFTWTTYADS